MLQYASLLKLVPHAGSRSVAFGADGNTIVTGDAGGFLRRWNASTGRRLAILCMRMQRRHPRPLRATSAFHFWRWGWPAANLGRTAGINR